MAALRPSCFSPAMSRSARWSPQLRVTWLRPMTSVWCCRRPAFARRGRSPSLASCRPAVAAARRRPKLTPAALPTSRLRIWGRAGAAVRQRPERSRAMTVAASVGGASTGSKVVVVTALGLTQIFAWGSSYYLPAVLAKPIAAETGWSSTWIIAGLSLGLALAGLVSPLVGQLIGRFGGRPVLAASAILLALGLVVLAAAQNL